MPIPFRNLYMQIIRSSNVKRRLGRYPFWEIKPPGIHIQRLGSEEICNRGSFNRSKTGWQYHLGIFNKVGEFCQMHSRQLIISRAMDFAIFSTFHVDMFTIITFPEEDL